MMKFLALTSCLLARITLTLISPSAMPVIFIKSIFRNLSYKLYELPCAFLYVLCELLEEQAVSCGNSRSNRPEVFCKKGVLRNFPKFTGKHLYQRLFFNKGAFCEISKNTFFYRTPSVAASKIIVFKKIGDSLTNFTFSFQIQILLFLRVE